MWPLVAITTQTDRTQGFTTATTQFKGLLEMCWMAPPTLTPRPSWLCGCGMLFCWLSPQISSLTTPPKKSDFQSGKPKKKTLGRWSEDISIDSGSPFTVPVLLTRSIYMIVIWLYAVK